MQCSTSVRQQPIELHLTGFSLYIKIQKLQYIWCHQDTEGKTSKPLVDMFLNTSPVLPNILSGTIYRFWVWIGLFLIQNFLALLWLAWNSLWRHSWSQIHRDLPPFVSRVLGLNVCYKFPVYQALLR